MKDRASSAPARSAACSAAKLAAGRGGCHVHRPRPASRGDAGERRDAASAAARAITVHPRCRRRSRPRRGPQDYVVVTLKAHSLPGAAPQIAPHDGAGQRARHRRSTAFPTGISTDWTAPGATGAIESVDPGGRLWDMLPPSQAIGCVVYPGGRGRRARRDRAHLWRPVHASASRTAAAARERRALSKALIAAGLKAPVRPRIRDEIWVKLWGNLAFNPLSALTMRDARPHHRRAGFARGRAAAMMLEAQGRRRGARRALRDRRRQAHRRRGRGRRAQDLDAAGSGTRPADGDRRSARAPWWNSVS